MLSLYTFAEECRGTVNPLNTIMLMLSKLLIW